MTILRNRATMRDVAKALNLSPMTVSKALRDTSDISRETKELVLQATRELGYLPNNWARAARGGKFNNMAFVYSCPSLKDGHPDTAYDHEFLNGIEEVCGNVNMHLAISRINKEMDDITPDDLPKVFKERVTDGIIIECEINEVVKEALRNQGIPAIYLNSNIKEADHCVYRDEERAAYDATEYLIRLGHRKILMPVTTFLQHLHFSAVERRDGYAKAMTDHGLTPWMLDIPQGICGNEMAALVIAAIKSNTPPTAIISAGAETICVEALRQGIKVPEDISLFALDLPYPSTRVFFHLDRSYMNRYEMGKIAAEMMLRKIRNPEGPIASTVYTSRLEALGSCRRISGPDSTSTRVN